MQLFPMLVTSALHVGHARRLPCISEAHKSVCLAEQSAIGDEVMNLCSFLAPLYVVGLSQRTRTALMLSSFRTQAALPRRELC